uniref:Uncharacterized protein n=1 Tax=Bougainvillea spectabilis TaxID=146096 RepID=A0A7T1T1Z9_9CARY|nr:hypothetical protein KQ602_mgp03 [Bougainvillea spectabilis]QPP04921.1 hypothetical protein [Bougainvillea spectabilis]
MNIIIRFIVSFLAFFVASFFPRLLEDAYRGRFFLFLFCILVFLIFIFRSRYRKLVNSKISGILLVFIYVLLFVFSVFFRFVLFEQMVALFGSVTTAWLVHHNVSSGSSGELVHHNVSSGSSGADGGLPALESSSSSESLTTYRTVIAAENEAEIYVRIRELENLLYYNIPPQHNPGEYERLVREHFDQALNVTHFLQIYDNEYFELQVLERKGLLQDRLENRLLTQPNLEKILELSPYNNIRKEAYYFLQDKLEPLNNLEHAFQRHLMDGNLNSFIRELNEHGRNSEIYREFYRHFTDEDFRRSCGLPLP